VDDGVRILVHENSLQLASGRQRAGGRKPDLAVEQAGDPAVHARHVLELGSVVENDRHALAGGFPELGHHALTGGSEPGLQRAPRSGVSGGAPLHDEVRRDFAPEPCFRARLTLDLVQQPARRPVVRIRAEHRAQVFEGPAGVVAAVIEMGQQQTHLGVGLGARGGFQRRQRLVGAPGVHGRQPEPPQQGRRVRGPA
jgi:hypothetical protein